MTKLKLAPRIAPPGSFRRGVSVLAGGTAASQILLFAAAPILTRLYSPDDFGLLAIYAALLGIGGVVVSLRYQLAIPLPESDQEAAWVALAALAGVMGTVLMSTVIVALFRAPIARGLGAPELGPFLWLLPVGLLALGTYQVFKYWAIRKQEFGPIARSKITQSVTAIALQLGLFSFGPFALLLGQAAGHGAGGGRLARSARAGSGHLFRNTAIRDIWAAAVRYRRFPLYSTWGAVFNKAGGQLPPILFASLFSPAAAGIYFLTHRVLALPMQFIGRAISDVFLTRAAKARHDGDLPQLIKLAHNRLTYIAVPPTILLILAGPDLFALVFGSAWREAGVFARWMAPWIYLVFVTSPLTTVFSVLEKQGQEMLFQFALLAARIGALFIGYRIGTLQAAVALFAGVSALYWVVLLLWVVSATGNQWQTAARSTGNAMIWAVPIFIPFVAVLILGGEGITWILGLTATGFVGGLRYYGLVKTV